jgi:hypothetical protein
MPDSNQESPARAVNHLYARQVSEAIEMVPPHPSATLSDNKARHLARAYLDSEAKLVALQEAVRDVPGMISGAFPRLEAALAASEEKDE